MYEKVAVTMTGPQLRKLHRGHVIQLTKNQISDPKYHMMLHPETAKKINKARMSGKGVRMQCTPHEVEMSGEGLREIWDWLKTNVPKAVKYVAETAPKVGKWVSENVIQTPYYQEHVRPVLREKVEGFVEGKPYSNLTMPLVKMGEEKTGAFGVRQGRKSKPKPKPKPKAKSTRKTVKGGSFRVHI